MSKCARAVVVTVVSALWLLLAGRVGHPTVVASAYAQDDAPFGLTMRTPLRGVNFPLDPPLSSGGVEIFRPFHSDLSFERPLYIAAAPGNERDLFVVEQPGTIRRFVNSASTRSSSVFIDLRDRVLFNGGEHGLLGLAFHPAYETNGHFYVYYTPRGGSRHAVVSRFTRSAGNPDVGDPSSESILLRIDQPPQFEFHNGGCLQFGPDGKLYIAVGDGGNVGDPLNNAQNLRVPLGKLLRLNADGSIPSGNPDFGVPGARREIWAYGLRNPWRFSFDSANGRLWLGDVGQSKREEIDLIKRGGNYGWRIFEAGIPYTNPENLPASAFERPVFSYPPTTSSPVGVAGRSITGGYVYRGSAVPALASKYVFADFIAGRVWALDQADGVAGGTSFVGEVPLPVSFGADNAGNLYIASFDGSIYSFRTPRGGGGGGAGSPRTLSQTGLFADTTTLTPNPGLIEYDINAPFWSDGTSKRRWIGLGGMSRITFGAAAPWVWPRKAVVVKHFEIDLSDGSRKRLETRVLFNGSSGWRGYTYRWNDAGTDANLLPDSRTSVKLEVLDRDSPSGVRRQTYVFPSRSDCQQCHTAVAGTILGAGNTAQLNRDFVYSNGVTDNQLRAFNHIGLFDREIGSAARYPALADPADTSSALGPRARAYLDTNCSQCHRPGGPTPVSLDLRASRSDAQLKAVGVRPNAGSLGLSEARVIAPGSKERSVLWERMRRLDGNRMPPIGSHTVDADGVELIGQWIDSLSSTPPSIAFGSSSRQVSEAAGRISIRVQLSAATSLPVQVAITAGGSAKSPADYAAPPRLVTIPAGQTSANLTLRIVDDTGDEPKESLILRLASPTNAALGTPSAFTVTINDDD